LFTLDKKVRMNCEFTPRSLVDEIQPGDPKFNYIVCRNVLIYFSPEEVDQIVKRLLNSLAPKDAILTVGHSEALDYRKFGIESLGHSSYAKAMEDKSSKAEVRSGSVGASFESRSSSTTNRVVSNSPKKKHRVLVVDDSNTVRAMMSKSIEGPDFETVMAEDAFKADEILKTQSFDIITLDLHMPGKDGHQWLLEKRKEGMETPVIIVSDANPAEAQAVLNVLGDGAQDYIEKKDLREQHQLIQTRLKAIIEHKSNIAKDNLSIKSENFETDPQKMEVFQPDILVFGASTGGTEALIRAMKNMPPNPPPIVVVQHISVDFAEAFSLRLAEAAGVKLAGPEQKTLEPGYLYMSIEDKHIGIKKLGAKLEWELVDSAKVSSHRPSVDFMFDSVAAIKDLSVLAVLLTGMGKDGARGLLNLKNKGALTCCQDAESSVVWGMPGEATKLGAPQFVGTTEKIRELINKALVAPKQKKAA
jgi:two-component system chemotaxis response regulator CheB